MEKKLYELKIDPELRDYIPPLGEKEFELLTEQLIDEGCTEALTVWDGYIVDGHNRYQICHEHNIPFAIQEMEFESKVHAMLWMAKKQLGRRNLMPYQKCELVFPLEELIAQEAETKRRQKISEAKKVSDTVQISAPSLRGKKTRDIMADMAGVSHDTYARAKVISKEADEDVLNQLRIGKTFIGTVYRMLKEDKPKERSRNKEEPQEDRTQSSPDPVRKDYEPIIHIDGSLEVPCTRGEQERVPRPFPFVRDQVQFAVENMIREIQIGLNWLRDEDTDKIEELKVILNDGYQRAKDMIRTVEGTL